MSFIRISDLEVAYESRKGRLLAIRDFNLDIKEGEFVSILGPSGCGKTSLLKVLDGLLKPVKGQCLINNFPINGPGTDRALVFQEFALFPWRTVVKNVEFGLERIDADPAKRRARSRELLNLVGLSEFEEHYPHELSGGMKQRVALARALAVDPQILLMDEPFASVDAYTREELQVQLLNIWESKRKTIVFVTHSIDEAIFLSDRIVLVSTRPARVREIITPDFSRPRSYEIKGLPEFAKTRLYIWRKFEEEIFQGKKENLIA